MTAAAVWFHFAECRPLARRSTSTARRWHTGTRAVRRLPLTTGRYAGCLSQLGGTLIASLYWAVRWLPLSQLGGTLVASLNWAVRWPLGRSRGAPVARLLTVRGRPACSFARRPTPVPFRGMPTRTPTASVRQCGGRPSTLTPAVR